jgi:hypothetical protein
MNIVMANQLIFKENDLRLLVGFTKKAIPGPTPNVVVSLKKSKSFDRLEIPIGFTVTQSNQRINGLI